ncbi:UNVERIFIED_CONTAM: Retrovirus-related Pol polyprotein from type-2 retrotransposable element R2DM [Sesamum angustifolium]|uniref:Retrovirus-related Pol polyprotein from type-2 retrotransposable element R2DM n=1 Tax=Sesamum angustifolium TaxID=2727405 RepID=A0AAW2JFK0_9LAMI
MRQFLWQGSAGSGNAKVAWHGLANQKEEGGLSLTITNQALMLKQLWRILQNDGTSIWVDWIQRYRLRHSTIWTFNGALGSWGWKKMLKLRPLLQRGVIYKIGDGSSFSLWQDAWHERGPLCLIFPRGPEVTGLPLSSSLSSVIQSNQWCWPASTDADFIGITAQLPPLHPSAADYISWRSSTGKFTFLAAVSLIQPTTPRVSWSVLLQGNFKIPRHGFILWMAILEKLSTMDKPWVPRAENGCVLCGGLFDETHDHLFFKCSYSKRCLSILRRKIRFQWPFLEWQTGLIWASKRWRGPHLINAAFRATLAALVYHLWAERNNRKFSATSASAEYITNRVLDDIRNWNWPSEYHIDVNEIITKLPAIHSGTNDTIIWNSSSGNYSAKDAYDVFSEVSNSVEWASLFHGPFHTPRHKFILWLAILERLSTLDKPWCNPTNQDCVLCNRNQIETHNHLFFCCTYTKTILQSLGSKLRFNWPYSDWNLGIKWASRRWRGPHLINAANRALLAAVIYYTWKERNSRIFQGTSTSAEGVTKIIMEHMRSRIGYNQARLPPRSTIKVDIQKAYDSVEWDFLFEVLKLFNFPARFIGWIEQCVTTVSFSISLNGSIYGYFPGARGLRQGDPMSPYLFVLVMEIWTTLLRHRVQNDPNFQFHWKCKEHRILSLCFADDVLLFCKAHIPSVQVIKDTLTEFANMSGLKVNASKSHIIISKSGQNEKQQILNLLGFQEGSLPVKYLGVPLTSSRLTLADCSPLIHKVDCRLSGWSHLNLSFAGRALLIKSVLSTLHNYWASVFILPKGIIKLLESKMRKFLWQGSTGKGYAKVAWDLICKPKEEGGLGFRSIETVNRALMLKHLWRLVKNDGSSIWVDWITHFRLKKSTLWTFDSKAGSWGWKKMIKLRFLLKNALHYKVGNGNTFSLWQDIWHERGPLCLTYPNGPTITGLPLDSLINCVLHRTDGTGLQLLMWKSMILFPDFLRPTRMKKTPLSGEMPRVDFLYKQ